MLDVSREDMAVITVSQSLNTLGIIEGANAVALSMFGYNKRDMVGKNISLIVPTPMNARHDAYLKSFLDSGRNSVRTSLFFLLQGSGQLGLSPRLVQSTSLPTSS